jgi:hypothetical protein
MVLITAMVLITVMVLAPVMVLGTVMVMVASGQGSGRGNSQGAVAATAGSASGLHLCARGGAHASSAT